MIGKSPFTISRTPSQPRIEPNPVASRIVEQNDILNPKRQSSFIANTNRIISQQSSFKNTNHIQKLDHEKIQALLEEYNRASLIYRDEEFTQQADFFLTKISCDKRIPKEIKTKYPLYHILVAISKIFLMNEYEIVVSACFLDKITWKYEDYVTAEEASQLEGFPLSGGIEVTNEGKRFIIYLLLIGFSLKQRLNDLGDFEKISAYCQKLCPKFHVIYNRWTRVSQPKFDAIEINLKWKYLCKRNSNDSLENVKDYNHIVDNIMTLTGSYSSKSKLTEPTSMDFGGKLASQNGPHESLYHSEEPSIPLLNNLTSKDFDTDLSFGKRPSLTRDGLGAMLDKKAFNDALMTLTFYSNNSNNDKRSGFLEDSDKDNIRKKPKTENVTILNRDNSNNPFPLSLTSMNSIIKNMPNDEGQDQPGIGLPPLSRGQSTEDNNFGLGRTFSTFSFIADKN